MVFAGEQGLSISLKKKPRRNPGPFTMQKMLKIITAPDRKRLQALSPQA